MRRVTGIIAILVLATAPRMSSATPFFARQLNLPCTSCHSGFPRLNAYGLAFKANNFRLPGPDSQTPLIWKKTVPLAVQVKPTWINFSPGSFKGQFTDTQLLGGGLVAPRTSFYLHHSYFVDGRPQSFPSWEFWVQQAIEDKHSLMVKAGQFELPFCYSPEINRTTISYPVIFFSGNVASNDVQLGGPVAGIQVSGRTANSVRIEFALGAPASNQPGIQLGDRAFFGRFRDVFGRVSVGEAGRSGGAFVYLTSPESRLAGGPGGGHGSRFGLDGNLIWKGNQIQGMWVYGETSRPAASTGTLRGGFVEADRMIRPWFGVTARLDVQSSSAAGLNHYLDAKTFSLRFYPYPHIKIAAEFQSLDHGGSSTGFLAAIAF